MSQFEPYTNEFYELISGGSLQSARVIVPVLLRNFLIRSVVDVGCGIGTWLKVFEEHKIPTIMGFDGPHIDKAMLKIRQDAFIAVDLCSEFNPGRRYDLAMSLEVAEHLPEEQAVTFVGKLTDAAPIVVFSAAVPGQVAVGHINMQWQDYWRAIFANRGYMALDLIRPKIWGSAEVEYWYQQNTIVYCENSIVATRPDLPWVSENTSLNIIHPFLYEEKIGHYEEGIRKASELHLRKAISAVPGLTIKALERRLRSLRYSG